MSSVVDKAALPLVIKVGGSFAENGQLGAVLETIARTQRPCVVVAGGGAFADKVRDVQRVLGFDDVTAHRLAMLGMHQMSEEFVKLNGRFQITDSLAGIASVTRSGKLPIWVPLPTLEDDETIPADWSITSDGIAARLAELLGGAPLVVLKSCRVPAACSAAALADEGILDPMFGTIVDRAALNWQIFGQGDDQAFAALLA